MLPVEDYLGLAIVGHGKMFLAHTSYLLNLTYKLKFDLTISEYFVINLFLKFVSLFNDFLNEVCELAFLFSLCLCLFFFG